MRPPPSILSVLGLAAACARAEAPANAPDIAIAPVSTRASLGVASPTFSPATVDATASDASETSDGRPLVSRCEGVKLELAAHASPHGTRFVGTLVNDGSASFSLVEPGDGSDAGFRTPAIKWKVTTPAGDPVPRLDRGRCGNMNAIQAREIFTLAPHARHVLSEWFGSPDVAPGRYLIVAVYENDPRAPVRGISLGHHDDTAMERIRSSTPCRVESNAVTADIAQP